MSFSEIVDDEEELYGSSEDDEGRSPEEDEELSRLLDYRAKQTVVVLNRS